MADSFPEDVVAFLDRNVESIDQLEILRVLGEDRTREWTAADLAAEVQARLPDVTAHLAALAGRGLVATEARGADAVSRYGPRDPDLDRLLQRLLQLYRERPVSMIRLVYARAADPLRSFSDAFRLRKDGG